MASSFMEDKDGFLSTPSARRATSAHQGLPTPMIISIHALREEGDFCKPPCSKGN